jgi:hypothetical protein
MKLSENIKPKIRSVTNKKRYDTQNYCKTCKEWFFKPQNRCVGKNVDGVDVALKSTGCNRLISTCTKNSEYRQKVTRGRY